MTDDQAVDVFRSAIHKLGWIFRPLTNDYGIDAEVELVGAANLLTGALLRFQIKGTNLTKKKIRVKSTSFRYWLISPIPIFAVLVFPQKQRFLLVDILDYANINKVGELIVKRTPQTITVDFAKAIPQNEWVDYLETVASEHHRDALEISNYTLYNPVLQEISCQRLFRQHGGDIDKMLRWYREEVPDEQLAQEYGHAAYLKQQIVADPTFIVKLKKYVYGVSANLISNV